MTHAIPRRARRGFTLAEMIIATTMLGLFGASAITFYLRSLRSVSNTAGRNDAQQTASFALDFVDHDLRIAGTGLAPGQPLMIEAATNAIAFNADLITHDTSASASGTYYDPNIADSIALVWPKSSAQNLKLSGAIPYPDSTYFASAGVLGEAETVQFWIQPDTPVVANRFALWRQVNANAPAIVAKGIYLTSNSTPVFRYYYVDNTTNSLKQFNVTRLPIYHVKGTPASQAALDSIKEVRIAFTGWFHDPQTGQDVYRTVDEMIRIPNAYMSRLNACSSPPSPVAALSTVPSTGGKDTVGLNWNRSPDDGAGKNTVRMYLLYRKRHVDSTYAPINSVTATGAANYAYNDNVGLTLGTSYDYSIVARDCTPALSSAVKALPVTPN